MSRLTHLNSSGEARMVDIGEKGDSEREAVARGRVMMKPTTLEQIKTAGLEKGDVLAVARVAGLPGASVKLNRSACWSSKRNIRRRPVSARRSVVPPQPK